MKDKGDIGDIIMEIPDISRFFLEDLGLGVVVILEGKIAFVNDSLADLLGYDVKELVGKNFFDVVSSEYKKVILSRYKRRLEGRDVEPYVRFGILSKKGEKILVEAYFTTIQYQDKIGSFGIVKDVTKVVNMEKNLKEYEKNLHLITNSVDAGILLVDVRGIIVYANRYTRAFFRTLRTELVGKPFLDFVLSGHKNMLGNVIKLVYNEGKEFVGHIEMDFLGEHRYVKVRMKPIDVQGIRFALITFIDETSEVLYRRELEEGYKRQKELFLDTVKALATAVDAKDAYTKGHSLRVAKYSKMIAYELGFSGEKLELIEIAGLLHDIGKIGIRDTILKKGSKLSPDEFEEMKKHPEIGAKIVGNVKELSAIVPAILYHHERVDGSGYPSGLKGEQIPIEAKIIAVADAYDAMTTNRPYRKAIPSDVAIKEIEKYKDIYFCPKVIEAMKKALKRIEAEKDELMDVVNGKVV